MAEDGDGDDGDVDDERARPSLTSSSSNRATLRKRKKEHLHCFLPPSHKSSEQCAVTINDQLLNIYCTELR